MSRVLSVNVTVGGVRYRAGTAVPDDVAKRITAEGVWADSEPDVSESEEAPDAETADAADGTEPATDATAPTVKVRRKGSK